MLAGSDNHSSLFAVVGNMHDHDDSSFYFPATFTAYLIQLGSSLHNQERHSYLRHVFPRNHPSRRYFRIRDRGSGIESGRDDWRVVECYSGEVSRVSVPNLNCLDPRVG